MMGAPDRGGIVDTWDLTALGVEPHYPQVLRSDDQGRAILIVLPAGEELQEHQTHEAAYVLVVDGRVEYALPDGETATGGPGLLAHFQPAERRQVRALDASRLLLVLVPWPGEGHHT
jgi:quercetin dioxygenase-like cupin family protein